MLKKRNVMMVMLVLLCGMSQAHETHDKRNYYRTLWNPVFHGERLDYCMHNDVKVTCGLTVANKYCRALGYDKANQERIDHHVGVTRELSRTTLCKGHDCYGFSHIRCVSKFKPGSQHDYAYRIRKFAFPRFNHARIDWCYEQGMQCGARVAHSFCRRMGYTRAKHYRIQKQVPATVTLGSREVCLKNTCNAFESITCYR